QAEPGVGDRAQRDLRVDLRDGHVGQPPSGVLVGPDDERLAPDTHACSFSPCTCGRTCSPISSTLSGTPFSPRLWLAMLIWVTPMRSSCFRRSTTSAGVPTTPNRSVK